MKPTPHPKEVEVQEWLQDVIIANTPWWAHLLAIFAQYRGLRWVKYFPLPIVRYFTDVSVKTDTRMDHIGRKQDVAAQVQTFRLYKRGRLIAQKEFRGIITRSPYQKVL